MQHRHFLWGELRRNILTNPFGEDDDYKIIVNIINETVESLSILEGRHSIIYRTGDIKGH